MDLLFATDALAKVAAGVPVIVNDSLFCIPEYEAVPPKVAVEFPS